MAEGRSSSKDSVPALPREDSSSSNDSSFSDDLSNIEFFAHSVVRPYSLKARFSSLLLETQIFTGDDGSNLAIHFDSLFKVDHDFSKINLGGRCSVDPAYKNTLLLSVVSQILCPLSLEVILNKSYRQKLRDATGVPANVRSCSIGIGDRGAWYGEPDARVRATVNSEVPVVEMVGGDEDGDEDGSVSGGDSVLIEAKTKIRSSNLAQAIGIAVVSSFTERNHHPKLNSMVPTLLINGRYFQILLYDCEQDVLLISRYIPYKDPSGSGRKALWIVINHRTYSKPISSSVEPPCNPGNAPIVIKSGFRAFADTWGYLPRFESLFHKTIVWDRKGYPDRPVSMRVEFVVTPQPHKRPRTK